MSTPIAHDVTKPVVAGDGVAKLEELNEKEEQEGNEEEECGEPALTYTDLPFLPFGPQRHPCPRRRHHPGENCCCAERLSLHVPHGYCSAGDAGAVHAARAQNLRWRLSAPTRHPATAEAGLKVNNSMPHLGVIEEFFTLRKVSSAGDVEASTSEGSSQGGSLGSGSDHHMAIPPSLRVLAEDHLGNCANLDLRPLEPASAAKFTVRSATKGSSCGGLNKKGDHGEARPRGVRFRNDEGLVAEVPVLVGLEGGRKRIPQRSSTPRRVRSPHQLQSYCTDVAQSNLQKLVDNHHEVMSGRAVTECLSFLWRLYEGNKHSPPAAIETH